jgi:hypothetical protein
MEKTLTVALRNLFPPSVIAHESTTFLADRLDDVLYTVSAEHFGRATNQQEPRKRNCDDKFFALKAFRKKKRALKKAWKKIACAGDLDPACKMLKAEWRKTLKEHNKLARSVKRAEENRRLKSQQRKFDADPFLFGRKLFEKKTAGGDPQFSADEAFTFFSTNYRDTERQASFSPMENMIRPPFPSHFFSEACPTIAELKSSAWQKRNSAAPGLNGLSYTLFKRCPCIMPVVHKIVEKVWSLRSFPASWSAAFIKLLPKSTNLTNPADFRPIALTNTISKIFLSVVGKRLENFMRLNNYISQVQKGFKAETPGCLEHSFTMFEALLDAKMEQRQIVVTWLDLRNAYGSVKHNLIQFALSWFHVPLIIQELIFDYYDKICAQVRTSNWATLFFFFDLGLFQGCVLSCILFNCVFQLLLDLLRPLAEDGYCFKGSSVLNHTQAFADDISVMTSTCEKNQKALDLLKLFLIWTRTMKENIKKCVSMAMKRFDDRSTHRKIFQRFGDTVYCPFDPDLHIGGEKIRFIVDVALEPGTLAFDHFKELGRWISVDVNEEKVKVEVRKRVLNDLSLVDASGVNGFCKLFLYEFFVVRRVSWQFLVHDFCLSFAIDLDKLAIPLLKRWAGLFRNADLGCLFRLRKDMGLQLTSFTFHFKHLQLVRCCLLKNSPDPIVAGAYSQKASRERSFSRTWCASRELEALGPVVEHEIRFGGQSGRAGLGNGHYVANPSLFEKRTLLVTMLLNESEKTLVEHSSALLRQGVWTRFDAVRPFDLSWKNLLSGPGPRLLSFVLNSLINSVRTPDMLQLWGYKATADCCLCSAKLCSLHHILVGCSVALDQGRYTWRHDSVLSNIETALEVLLGRINSRSAARLSSLKSAFSASFVQKGTRAFSPHTPTASSLDGSCDWQLAVDYKHKPVVFPPIILATDQRPDVVIWSESSRRVFLLELTCPAEEGIQAARDRKEARYAPLVDSINGTKCWTADLLTLEVGARGLVACHTFKNFRNLGMSSSEANALCRSLSLVSSRCSFAVFLAHSLNAWIPRGLVRVPPVAPPERIRFTRRRKAPGMSSSSLIFPSSLPPSPAPHMDLQLLISNGVKTLYHFTDRSCIPSIREFGLQSWVALDKKGIKGRRGSSALSRTLDQKKDLGDFVRLSFTPRHPMMYQALSERRIRNAVVLEIDLNVVLHSETLYSDRNAAAAAAVVSRSPTVVRYDVVLRPSVFSVTLKDRPFYQAEVLIRTNVSPSFISFPHAPASAFVVPHTKPKEIAAELKDERLSATESVQVRPEQTFVPSSLEKKSDSESKMDTGEIFEIWDLLDKAAIQALRTGNLVELTEILDYYPPLLLSLDVVPRPSPPLDREVVPPLSLCEYSVGPPAPSCLNCIPGIFFCADHQILCGREPFVQCNFCGRVLCWTHLDCFCTLRPHHHLTC